MDGKLVYLILMQTTLFAIGAALVGSAIAVRFRPRRWWAYVLVKLGLTAIIGTILFVIWPRAEVEPNIRAVWYIGGIVACAVGMTFVAGDLARRGGAEKAKRDAEKLGQ